MDGILGVHLIGTGVGESIVIQLPNGKVGVIDCCCKRLKTNSAEERLDANPTLRFLEQELHAVSLAFVAFTHPHEDHGRGMSQIFEHYHQRINEIWIFETYQEQGLRQYFKALLNEKRRLPVERIFEDRPGTFFIELASIRELVQEELRASRDVVLRTFQGYQQFGLAGEPVTFHFLGPSARLVDRYRARLTDNLATIVHGNRQANLAWNPCDVNHNAVCPSILVAYGTTCLVLGGDMECEAWQEVLAEQANPTVARPPLNCTFVKVSHHGSNNGYCDGLYDLLCERTRPVAALAPFSRHAHPLPSPDGVRHILKHVGELLATNDRQAAKSSGISVDKAPPCLSERWLALLAEHPEWVALIAPSLVDDTSVVAPLDHIPPEMAGYLSREPDLVRALRPSLWEVLPPIPDDARAERDYRVSLFFNPRGNELKKRRYVGRKAGRLVPRE